MKTRNLFLALALPAAFAACSNEEFMDNNAVPAENNLVELGEGFVLAGQGANETSTRGVWGADLMWSWLPTILPNGTGANSMLGSLNVSADEIGLCWTGELPDGTGNISNMVYTNYQFLHNGWLAEGQDAAKFNECTLELENGKVYKDIVKGSLDENSDIATIKNQLADDANKVSIEGVDTKLDLNTGIFTTSNKAIFGGSYIVYYPYNGNFADAASLPAISPVAYNDVTTGDVSVPHVAENTFMVGYARNLIGGSQASKFGVNPLSAIISLQLKQTGSAKDITKVALWSQDGFVTSVGLDASKIKSMGAAGGEALYVEGTKKTASTIVATLKSSVTLGTTATKIYLPILPTTAKDLKVILYTTTETAVIDLGKDYTFKAAQGAVVSVEMDADDFKTDALIAVDAVSLKSAVEGDYSKATNVTVIGDITLTDNVEVKNYVTVEGGKIIVPEDKTLTIDGGSTIQSAVEVQGQTCCGGGSAAGKMLVNTKAIIAGNVNILAGYGDKADGLLEFANNAGEVSTVAATATIVADGGSIDFKGVTDIYGTLTLNAGGVATLSAATSDVNVKGGTVNNNGTFVVDNGKFAMLDASGNTIAAAGKNFKNNGVFIDNIGTTIGGATQYMAFGTNGDYICKVNVQARLDEAYANKAACSTIQFVNAATATYDLKNATQHNNKYINVVDNGVLTIITNSVAAVTIGNLTVMPTRTLKVSTGAKPINVSGNIVLDGTFTTEEDVQGMTANNLTVNDGGAVTFENRNTKLGVTLAVANTIEVKQGGTFTMTPAASDKNVADVTCKKLIEGGTFVGKPRVIE
ncbi:hypothetical protein [uncultured Bacteroides sp.]|uniref:hypothetical protein n=1 Tax=uncultured Bacteroides sp. TaxID=162156 RepID=UPI0025EAFD16|nr:hypothetical protein [uncultured Bacteroides sp.]